MSEIETIDVRGYSCPVPAQRTKMTLRKLKSGTCKIFVDAGASKDNCVRTANKIKWETTEVKELEDGSFELTFSKPTE